MAKCRQHTEADTRIEEVVELAFIEVTLKAVVVRTAQGTRREYA